MKNQKFHQIQIIWQDMASPISIPRQTRNRLVDLLGNLISEYWKNCKQINDSQQREDQNEK
ncbi:hypothetical protein D1BOALGB6SA_7699 [Olavius sp. associated proteobacterium Delta 1]|nr:hypothetical protein D1BOALGB6SA_7699 [Olavius sp. associated proteobacterium Delta 1]